MGLRRALPQLAVDSGNVLIKVSSARTGQLLKKIETRNRFVLSGRNQLRDLILFPKLYAAPVDPSLGFTPDYVEIGSSGVATTDAMEALTAPVFRKLITRRIPLDSGFQIFLQLEPSEANDNDLREVGIFTLTSGGRLWARAIHTLIEKTSSISVTYEWTFTLAVP
jgi:hypothetical protein